MWWLGAEGVKTTENKVHAWVPLNKRGQCTKGSDTAEWWLAGVAYTE
jgi:hypothetical protein